MIQTVKLNSVEPFAYLRDILERIISGHTKANALISPSLHRSDAIDRWLQSPFARTEKFRNEIRQILVVSGPGSFL